eukprot:CFRG1476T1
MVQMTVIARVMDGLPLAASMEDETNSISLAEYKTQAKLLFKRLNDGSPARCTIDTAGPLCFHYMIEMGVCYLVLCEKAYPKKLAFAYLEEVQREFQNSYANDIGTAARPYAFISFDTTIQRLKRQYMDSRANRNLNKLNTELQDVQRIMTQNIQDVLGRGERIERVSDMASHMSEASKQYYKDAKYVNLQELYRKYGPVAIFCLIIVVLLYLRYSWFA